MRISNSLTLSFLPSTQLIQSVCLAFLSFNHNPMWTVDWSCTIMNVLRWHWMKLVHPCLPRMNGSISCHNWNPMVCWVYLWMYFGERVVYLFTSSVYWQRIVLSISSQLLCSTRWKMMKASRVVWLVHWWWRMFVRCICSCISTTK